MKVLVTGATGFIGQHLVRQLLEKKYDVSILARTPDKAKTLFPASVNVIKGDLTDSYSLLKACENIERVYHLGGYIAYKKSERTLMDQINIHGTRKLMDACITHNVKDIVYMSSVVAIGSSFTPSSLNEQSSYDIDSLNLGYFQSKHNAEKIVLNTYEEHGIPVYILNPSTVYGAGDAEKGSRKTQLKVAQGKFPFYTPGGVNIVSIEDVLYCLDVITSKGRPGERYIVAGENISIKELFTLIAQSAGVEPPKYPLIKPVVKFLGFLGDQLGKVGLKGPLNSETAHTSTMYHWFDSTKAQQELGFSPKPAEYAINQSVSWMKSNGLIS